MLALVRKLLNERPGMNKSCRLVLRGELSGEVSDPWMRRIIALADGRPSDEIAHKLYLDELRAGADMADLGLWRSLFCNHVEKTLKEMSNRGYIQLISRDLQSSDTIPKIP